MLGLKLNHVSKRGHRCQSDDKLLPEAMFTKISMIPYGISWEQWVRSRSNITLTSKCVSNHQPHDCLLKRFFRRRTKKWSKLYVTGLCAGNSLVPVNSLHKWPVTWKIFPFDDVIMIFHQFIICYNMFSMDSDITLPVSLNKSILSQTFDCVCFLYDTQLSTWVKFKLITSSMTLAKLFMKIC